MRKLKDILLFVFVSPEALAISLVFLVSTYAPGTIALFADILSKTDFKFTAIVGVPLAMAIGTYTMGFGLLNPADNKAELKAWPQYWMLKNRVVFSLAIAALAIAATIVGYYLLSTGAPRGGAIVISACWCAEVASVLTIAYARISLADILGGAAD